MECIYLFVLLGICLVLNLIFTLNHFIDYNTNKKQKENDFERRLSTLENNFETIKNGRFNDW